MINIDVTVYLDGLHGDCSETFVVGGGDPDGARLLAATRESLDEAVAICGPGVEFRAVGGAVQRVAKEKHGFRFVKT